MLASSVAPLTKIKSPALSSTSAPGKTKPVLVISASVPVYELSSTTE
ncbi:hypothetical protein PP590_gp02 [Pseudoalteromonas phage HS1]|nr:hypothetical protein PP590_gp02 [Pseudoalteromonas phage HS1]